MARKKLHANKEQNDTINIISQRIARAETAASITEPIEHLKRYSSLDELFSELDSEH